MLLTHALPHAVTATQLPALAAAQPTKNQSTLTVFVGVSDGRLVVDRAKSQSGFAVSEEFRRRLGARMGAAEIEKTIVKFRELLFDDLDKRFKSLDKIYRYSLNDTEKANEPNDELTMKVRGFPGRPGVGDWSEFAELFDRWAGAGAGAEAGAERLLLRQVFSTGEMLRELSSVGKQTALIFVPTAQPPPNAQRGSIRFRVADPIGNLRDESEYVIRFPNETNQIKAAGKRETVIKVLKPLEGKLWRGSQIKSRIEEYYAERGLTGVVKISPAGKEPREIVIPEGARIARLIFHKDVPAGDQDKIAYLILPDREFRIFVRTRPLVPITASDEAGREVVAYQAADFSRLGHTSGTEPFINQFSFQVQQLELSQLGFVAAQQQTPDEVRDQSSGSSYVDIYIFKAEEEEKGEKPDNVPATSVPSANEDGIIRAQVAGERAAVDFVPTVPNISTGQPNAGESASDGGVEGPQDQPSPTPSPSPTPAATPAQGAGKDWQPEDKKNYIGFGVQYKPGQSVRLFGLFQRDRLGLLSSQDALSVKAGAQDEALGALNYFSDFLLFNALHRRLSLQLTGKSEFNARRTFSGVETDERRAGGLLHVELEVFRDRANSMLRLYVEGRRATVHLIQNERIISKQNLTTLDFGGTYLFEDKLAYRPKQLRLEPRLRVGLGLARGEPQFTSFLLTGNYHQQLPRSMETDITGRAELATSQTPLYELPSLGGVDVLRGFREDDALGRKLWSLQAELWTPVPGTAGAEDGFAKLLRRQVRLAGFVDVGGVYQTTASQPGVRVGPGLGARIIYRPAIIKLDWAYGIGDAATTGRGRGRFYFSVGTNLPF